MSADRIICKIMPLPVGKYSRRRKLGTEDIEMVDAV
jgi:hypothetical protein